MEWNYVFLTLLQANYVPKIEAKICVKCVANLCWWVFSRTSKTLTFKTSPHSRREWFGLSSSLSLKAYRNYILHILRHKNRLETSQLGCHSTGHISGSRWWVMGLYIIHRLCRLRDSEVLTKNTWKLSHYILSLIYPEWYIDQINVSVSSWRYSSSIITQKLINNVVTHGFVKGKMQRN
jgi:hypothetical protein